MRWMLIVVKVRRVPPISGRRHGSAAAVFDESMTLDSRLGVSNGLLFLCASSSAGRSVEDVAGHGELLVQARTEASQSWLENY
jgi:hypothetical protein